MEPSAPWNAARRGSLRIVRRLSDALNVGTNDRDKHAFTKLQGQYLAYIATYTKLHRRPPAEADLQRFSV